MPTQYTRRLDLFNDAGIPNGDALLTQLTSEVAQMALPRQWVSAEELGDLPQRLAARTQRLPPELLRLAQRVPVWLADKGGDLATALWLAHSEAGADWDGAGFLWAILEGYIRAGRLPEAAAYAHFMLDVRFGWERVYTEGYRHEFMQQRDPNPLVWQVLEEVSRQGQKLRILELGCGVGNDAFGFLTSPLVESYLGLDVSQTALDTFGERLAQRPCQAKVELQQADFYELVSSGNDAAFEGVNLVYSYSSLHYFSSSQLHVLYAGVHRLLRRWGPRGFLAFGIKGAGSVWEGQGLPLYRPDVWINWDGQSRWFPSRHALARQLDDAGFELRLHALHDHWGYSEVGKRDVFHYVLCSARNG